MMGLLELCDGRGLVPGRAQAAAVVEAQQGAIEWHRHLRLDRVGLRERCFRLGRLASGQGQIATAASKRQGCRRKAGRRNGALELAERGLRVVEPAQADQRVRLEASPVEDARATPDTEAPGCAHRFCREKYPGRVAAREGEGA